MKLKKGFRKLAVLSAIGMMLGGNIVSAYADEINSRANTTDSRYQFDFAITGGTKYTAGRAKQDTSKTYMYCDTLTSGYKYEAKVYANLGGGNRIDASKGTRYTFYKSSREYMTNNVRQLGYTAAAIQGKAGIATKSVTAGGLWSPDSSVKSN